MEDHFPSTYTRAQCLCTGCVLIQNSMLVESHDYNSAHFYKPVLTAKTSGNVESKGKTSKGSPSASTPSITPASTPSITLADISLLLDEHRAALTADFKSSFESLTSTLDSIHSTITDGQRIHSLEANATEVDQRLQQLEDACSALKEDNETLKTKVADLEGRSRRQNLRIIGLPESIEGPRPSAFFSQLLVDTLGTEILASPPELDRAHQSLAPKPAPGGRPRPVILRFHRFQIKDLVIREARRQGELNYKGHKIRLYDDYSPDVLKQRAEYRSPMAELYKRGYKPALLFPAKLRITLPNGDRTWLMSAPEAVKFVQDLNKENENCLSNVFSVRKINTDKSICLSRALSDLQTRCVDSPRNTSTVPCAFQSSITDAAFSIWEINGIVSVKQLYIDGTFASFDQLALRDFIRNRFPSFPAIPPSTWVDTLLSINPNL
ncbi:hypothetical protein F7725_022320, partial [Dissostichus mawsoni]